MLHEETAMKQVGIAVPSSRTVALTSMMTALVYIATSISFPMPRPLGVWHIGDIASFIASLLCGPLIGAFACGIGAMMFDVWNPLWGGAFVLWAPATIIIRGVMGFVLGKLRGVSPDNARLSELVAMILAAFGKNIGYFLYDYFLQGSIAILDLFTFFPLSALDIAITIPLLMSLRKILGEEYLN